ncbi:hypothetical protein AYL99_08030 [Fonsecaea erecta]|uniref:Adenylate kinase n=1 Tax=Fonsecaea erecta TaxID=1367422 RepID=A0A178ZCA1_9EURO|nr:hypothetical protein AYL99_08030 [Fonsecaea erecta]OAP57292.1 hypothetical protein AYL99_08030 [Fonsecaea erecta]
MAETPPDTQYPLLIFIVGPPGSLAHEMGQRLAYEYGFFFVGVTERVERTIDDSAEAETLSQVVHNDARHARLPFVLAPDLAHRMATFLQRTEHLKRRACLVIEGFPRNIDQVPRFCKAAQRLFLVCRRPRRVAQLRVVGRPQDWDDTAPATGAERDASGWSRTAVGRAYHAAEGAFAASCADFNHHIHPLLEHFGTSATDDQGSATDHRRDLFRPSLSAGLVPGKVIVLDTGCGDEDECWARANDTLQSSLEFHTLLAEVEADFETMANDDDDDNKDDGEGCDGGDERAGKGKERATQT